MDAVLTKVEIPVVALQDVVSRASKGSTFIDVIPLSTMMEVKIKDNVLSAKTTNNSYYLTAIYDKQVVQPDFEIVVDTKAFTALVGKLKGEIVSISVEGIKITLQTKTGKYNFSYSTDTDGSIVKFPEPTFTPDGSTTHITPSELRSILSLNKTCKSVTKDNPALFNYYFDTEKVLTSNDSKAGYNPIKVVDRATALTPDFFELVPNVIDDNGDKTAYGVDISENNDSIMFFSNKGILTGKKASQADLESLTLFAQAYTDIFNDEMSNVVEISRTDLLDVIDPMILFTNSYEQNRIKITFTQTGMTFFDITSESEERVDFVTPLTEDIQPVVLEVNALELKEQLTACSEIVKLSFDDTKLKLTMPDGSKMLLGIVEVG